MKRIILFFAISLLISGCGSQEPPESIIQTAIAQTQASTIINTQFPSTNTLSLTITPKPTNTPRPTNTEQPTSTPTQGMDTSKAKAKNYVASQDSGGVILEVARILIADKNAVPTQDFSKLEKFTGIDTVVEIVFRIVNNTGSKVSVYADQGTVAINGEQIDLFDYSIEGASFGDDIGGDFLPGTTAIGGIWIGVKRTTWDQITKILINVNAPVDKNFNSLGPEFYFDIDVVDWTFEELPGELR